MDNLEVIEKVKKILDIEILINENILDYYCRDVMEYYDFLYLDNEHIAISIKEKESYNIFKEIEQLKRFANKNLYKELCEFENALINNLKKEDRAERLYLTYVI